MNTYNVIIIGSGAAAWSTADWLIKYGVKNIALITEGRFSGTSRNTGSDKQTYYKLSFTEKDCAQDMADALSSGGSMHHDTAFIEAANSVRCFLRLVEYGVPFPTDASGRFIGYQTDHDHTSRATSAGPLTSKLMTECLESQVLKSGKAHLIDSSRAIRIVKENGRAVGVVYLTKTDNDYAVDAAAANYVILATGGAAGTYGQTVYPVSQTGALGMAIDAGCKLNNITEWQYGIASTKVRWNLSGSYQQVIPTYYSVDEHGEKHEFLPEWFRSSEKACDMVFLKGYQWPFDSGKINGSSGVDIAVSEEIGKGRSVFMDFRTNPAGYSFDALCEEAKTYLRAANVNGDTPIGRLEKLNPSAVAFYKSKGIDLRNGPLEIAVCAQHMNGGIDVDTDWMTNVENLFAVGEAAGTFGVYRPGGSALNSTQVGGLRAAQYIARKKEAYGNAENTINDAKQCEIDYIHRCINFAETKQVDFSLDMSKYAGHCRTHEDIALLYETICRQYDNAFFKIESDDYQHVTGLYRYKDALTFQRQLCKTMLDVLPVVGSRGGAVYYKDGAEVKENDAYRQKAIVTLNGETTFEDLRPMPELGYNFETQWQAFQQDYGY